VIRDCYQYRFGDAVPVPEAEKWLLLRVIALSRGQPSAGRDSSWEPGPPGDYLANRLGDEAPTG